MGRTKTTLETPHGTRYLTRLCEHWSHRFIVYFDVLHGHIDFGEASCELAVLDNVLHITVEGTEAELDKLEAVVADHLQRISARGQQLNLVWQRVIDQPEPAAKDTNP